MTTPTLTIPTNAAVFLGKAIGPAVGSARKFEARIRTANFGDGYSQRSADGINSVRATVSVTIGPAPSSSVATVASFLAARKGYQAFYFTAPNEATARKWTCGSWTITDVDGDNDTLTADFVEVFDP